MASLGPSEMVSARRGREAVFHVGGILHGHGGQVFDHHRLGVSQGPDVSPVEPEAAVADCFDVADGVRDKEDSDSFGPEFVDFSHAPLAEIDVSNGEGFVDQKDFGIDMDGHSEGQADGHSCGICFYRLVDKGPNFGKSFDFLVTLVNLFGRETENGRVEIHIVAPGEFGVESGPQFQQGGDASVNFDGAVRGVENPGD